MSGRWLYWIASCVVLALSGMIVVNTIPYLSFGANFAFLTEKGALASDGIWRTSFYTHISGGMLCLIAGPFLLWNGLRGRSKTAHRWIGKLYAFSVLGCAGPAGFYLSFFSKGGFAGQSCFLLLSVLWWTATARAIQTVMSGRIAEHKRWMIRSYSLALSAVFFRIFHVAFFAAQMNDQTNYAISLWLSLVASLFVGEGLIRFHSPRQPDPMPLKGVLS